MPPKPIYSGIATPKSTSSRCTSALAAAVITATFTAVRTDSVRHPPGAASAHRSAVHQGPAMSDAEDVLDVEEGDFDAPAGRIAGDDVLGGGGEVGGDQCYVVAAGAGLACALAQEDDAGGSVRQVPYHRQTRSVTATVAVVA